MYVFAISDLDRLNSLEIALVEEHWRRRVDPKALVAIPGGVLCEQLSWLEELPGQVIINPVGGDDAEGLRELATGLSSVTVLEDDIVRYPGARRNNLACKDLLVVGGPTDLEWWESKKEWVTQTRGPGQNVLLLLANECPVYVNSSSKLVEKWDEAKVNIIAYGQVSEDKWHGAYQGRIGKNQFHAPDYRLVSAQFLNYIPTLLGDVDHAGWLRKERERLAETKLGWEKSANVSNCDRGESKDCLKITRPEDRAHPLYSLPSKPPSSPYPPVQRAKTFHSACPGADDPLSEGEKWMEYLEDNKSLSVETFRHKWPGAYGWFQHLFHGWSSNVLLGDILNHERNLASKPPGKDIQGWREALGKFPLFLSLAELRDSYPALWECWKQYWESYPEAVTVGQVIESEADLQKRQPLDLCTLWVLCEKYSNATVEEVIQKESDRRGLLEAARETYGSLSMSGIQSALKENMQNSKGIASGGMNSSSEAMSREDERPVESASCLMEALAELDQSLTLMQIEKENPQWWERWREQCKAFKMTALPGDIQKALSANDDMEWQEILWVVDGDVSFGDLRQEYPEFQDVYPESAVYADDLSMDDLLALTLEYQYPELSQGSGKSTPSKLDIDEAVQMICEIDSEQAIADFEAELVYAVERAS